MRVDDDCGKIGATLTSPLLSFAPGEISTLILPDIPPSRISESVPVTYLTEQAPLNVADLECPSVGARQVSKSFIDDEHPKFAYVIGEPWLPLIAPPEKALALEEDWLGTCNGVKTSGGDIEHMGMFDPPKIMIPKESMVPPVTATDKHGLAAHSAAPGLVMTDQRPDLTVTAHAPVSTISTLAKQQSLADATQLQGNGRDSQEADSNIGFDDNVVPNISNQGPPDFGPRVDPSNQNPVQFVADWFAPLKSIKHLSRSDPDDTNPVEQASRIVQTSIPHIFQSPSSSLEVPEGNTMMWITSSKPYREDNIDNALARPTTAVSNGVMNEVGSMIKHPSVDGDSTSVTALGSDSGRSLSSPKGLSDSRTHLNQSQIYDQSAIFAGDASRGAILCWHLWVVSFLSVVDSVVM